MWMPAARPFALLFPVRIEPPYAGRDGGRVLGSNKVFLDRPNIREPPASYRNEGAATMLHGSHQAAAASLAGRFLASLA